MDACTNPDILRVMYFFLIIIDIVKIIVPIGLIIMGLVDFSKAVVVSDEKVQKNTVSLFLKRILYAVLVFAVPWIVGVVMDIIGNVTSKVNFTDCFVNANKECIDDLESGVLTGDSCSNKIKNQCWNCDDLYYWGVSPSSDSSCLSGWETINRDEDSCNANRCFRCNDKDLYHWGLSEGTDPDCHTGWHVVDENQNSCGIMQCWQCTGIPSLYHWGATTVNRTDCPNGWYIITRSEENCK